ncbi:glycosyltransferase [Undibacterium sp.]|jgi:glycosyltransferase involved in cell wall biosynthesis|uniref:glycosyltransferase n=1 Tax=Undibacterium sp. TaxID=1914977 RepID=UPI002B5FC6DC|nr:glycosyltransferase [Undibacterium sp.]HTD06467.1 glycosyltransferase [Undibacterium sp.]
MRIVIDLQACQSTGSRTRGIGRYSLALAKAMLRNAGGHEFKLMLSALFADTIPPLRRELTGLLPNQDIHVWHAPGPVADQGAGNLWRRCAGELIREQALAELRPDMVHVSSLFEGLGDDALTSIGKSGEPMPTAVTLYDLIPLINARPYLDNPQVRAWYYRKVQAMKNADLLLAISESSRQEGLDWLQLPAHRVVNISSAVDDRFQLKQYPSDQMQALRQRYGLLRPFVMYTGGIDLRKNIEALIRSYAALPGALRRQYQLAIVCSVQAVDRERLQKLAEQSGLEKDEMILTGFVPDEDLPLLYHLCSLFVFPSWHEGFGLPALEAMACGAPVIAANTSSLPEVIGCDDALFDPHSEAAITAKLHQALTNSAWSEQLRVHGLQQAKKFSWDASAKCAIAAFEEQHERRRQALKSVVAARAIVQRKPRLAYFSPLPPERSGISDYSAELLPELSRYYDIELIVDQEKVDDVWLSANFPVRTLQWFGENAGRFERMLYNFGNSVFHGHMFDLLERWPGVVVMHDFFLSGVLHSIDHSGKNPGCWAASLYASHGYGALIERKRVADDKQIIWKYPCNLPLMKNAEGVVVHSAYSKSLAKQWYSEEASDNWAKIPHLRRVPHDVDKEAARTLLGLRQDDFLLCSFGMLGQTKLNHQLLNAWLTSPLAQDPRCHLVFVGQNDSGEYGAQLQATIAASAHGSRIRITGFADMELFRTYLSAADAAVQLRGLSRGETSGTVLDCMAYGLPCIINDNGSMQELPSSALIKLPDHLLDADLREQLVILRNDPALRQATGALAVRHIQEHHAPDKVGAQYFEAIENFSNTEPASKLHRNLRKIADIDVGVAPAESDLTAVAQCLSANSRPYTVRQLLLDVSFLSPAANTTGAHAGGAGQADVRRRVAALISTLALSPPEAYRLEPVMMTPSGLRYARRLSCELLEVPTLVLEDELVETTSADVYISIDGGIELSTMQQELLAQLNVAGIEQRSLNLESCAVLDGHFDAEQRATAIHGSLGLCSPAVA